MNKQPWTSASSPRCFEQSWYPTTLRAASTPLLPSWCIPRWCSTDSPRAAAAIPHPEMQSWAPGLAAACHRGTAALWHFQTSWSGTARVRSTTPGSRSSRSCPKRGGTPRWATPATLTVSRPSPRKLYLNKNTACFRLKGCWVWASLVEPRGLPCPSASLKADQGGVVFPGVEMGTGIL